MNRTRKSIPYLIFTFALALGLACSDDDKPVQKDSAVPDMAVKVDGKTTVDMAKEASVDIGPDQAVVDMAPDKPLTPDMPPTSTNWTQEAVTLTAKLHAIGGKSKSEIYAAGASGLIVKYDGTKWATMLNPDTAKTKLTDVHFTSSYTYLFGDHIILYLSGGKWTKGYTSTSTYYSFQDVWGPSNSYYMFGAGEMGYYFARKTSSSPSSSWSSVYMGSSTLKNSMYGVWGASVGEIFIVGDNGTIWYCKTSNCITSSSSSNWKKATSPTTSHLKDIWGADSKNVFAVGLNGTIIKWDGTSWKKMTINTYTYFYGVWGTSATDVWAVGHPIFKKDEAIWHYDGTSWTKVPPPGQPYLNAIWGADKTTVYTVGNNGIYKLKKHPKP